MIPQRLIFSMMLRICTSKLFLKLPQRKAEGKKETAKIPREMQQLSVLEDGLLSTGIA